MGHNFRILPVGATYISKVGNDINAGTDPNLPKATLARYTTNHVVGCGVYKGAFTLFLASFSTSFIPDGMVVIDLTGALTLTQNNASVGQTFGSTTTTHTTVIRANGQNIAIGVGFNTFNYCHILSPVFTQPTSNANFTMNFFRSIIDGATSTITALGTRNYSYSQVFNSSLGLNVSSSITNSYVDQASVFTMPAYFTTPATQFRNNNFRGILIVNSVAYELKKDKAGNTINPNPSVLDLVTIDATVYARGNFSEDMDYLAIDKRGYNEVASTSPALFADSSAVGNIANAWFADSINASDSEFTGGVVTNLTLSVGDYIVTAGTSGNVVSLARQVAPIAVPVGRTNIRCLLNFNSSQAIGSSENNNVTIVENYPVGHADGGDNPRRLTYQMQWSDADTAPASDSDWTNQGYTAPNTWVTFESFQTPLIDVNGRGNGEPLFNPTGAVGLKLKWRRFKITVRNGIG